MWRGGEAFVCACGCSLVLRNRHDVISSHITDGVEHDTMQHVGVLPFVNVKQPRMALVCDDQILVSSYGENSIRSFSIEGDTTWTCILPHPRAMVRGPSEHSSLLYGLHSRDPVRPGRER